MKKIYFYFLIIISIVSCGRSESTVNIEEINSLEQGKSIITETLNNYQRVYEGLCEKKRNDNLKYEYQDLNNSINKLYSVNTNCSHLSYQEQIELGNFIINKINEYPDLKELTGGKVNCW